MTVREKTRLTFFERPDLSPFLVHLTKNTESEDECTAFDNLSNILKTGKIWGSNKKRGFVKGPHKAACFMDVPLNCLKYILNKANTDPNFPRYEPYGVLISKAHAYKQGVRPVIYLSEVEQEDLNIPEDHLWRVVRFEGVGDKSVGWLHEREWRSRGDFSLPKKLLAVLVKDNSDVRELGAELRQNGDKYSSVPTSIIPLDILCQGLPYMG